MTTFSIPNKTFSKIYLLMCALRAHINRTLEIIPKRLKKWQKLKKIQKLCQKKVCLTCTTRPRQVCLTCRKDKISVRNSKKTFEIIPTRLKKWQKVCLTCTARPRQVCLTCRKDKISVRNSKKTFEIIPTRLKKWQKLKKIQKLCQKKVCLMCTARPRQVCLTCRKDKISVRKSKKTFEIRILLMCVLRAHNSKPILEKVYWELKNFWQLFQFPIKLFQKYIY